MKQEKRQNYDHLLEEFKEQFLLLRKGDINSRQRLDDEIQRLCRLNPDFQKAYGALLRDYEQQDPLLINLQKACYFGEELFLEELREFAHGKPVDFTDRNLIVLISLYHTEPDFREACDTDSDIAEQDVMTYWQNEYLTRMQQHDAFAESALLVKLRCAAYGDSFEFNEIELGMLERLHRTSTHFQERIAIEGEAVHHARTYWLEQHQKRISKNANTKNSSQGEL